ncbi:MAG: hypothetical protein SCALA701_35700 [Candidatus Scalindua sp.]|nr:MAG: hypothetical protein SCALA701_35700 [Candidatus Scalindua sp.]
MHVGIPEDLQYTAGGKYEKEFIIYIMGVQATYCPEKFSLFYGFVIKLSIFINVFRLKSVPCRYGYPGGCVYKESLFI